MNKATIEVHFSDLMAMLLKASKTILCLVLVFGFMGGVYGAYNVAKAQPRVTQEDVEAAEKRVTVAESNLAKMQSALSFRSEVKIPGATQKVERAERTVSQLQEYMQNSIYYRMNPYHHGAARLCFSVETDQAASSDTSIPSEDFRAGIVVAYTKMCPFDMDTMNHVKAIMGIEATTPYIEELISITSDEDHHVVEIHVCFEDLQKAKQVVTYLFQTMTERAQESLPKHQVMMFSTSSGYESDLEMQASHETNEASLLLAEQNLLDANASFQAIRDDVSDEQAVADATATLNTAQRALNNAKINYAKNRPSLRNMAKCAIKYGILGGLLGILLGCCFALIKGLFGGIIQNQNEVISRYSFPLIGVLPRAKKLWFDKAIRKLEGEPTSNFEATAQATAQSLLSRINNRSVCLISTCGIDIAKKLASHTEDKVQYIGNIIDNAEAVIELAKFDGIVLVEERGKSRVDLINAEVLRAKALNKEILGIVLA